MNTLGWIFIPYIMVFATWEKTNAKKKFGAFFWAWFAIFLECFIIGILSKNMDIAGISLLYGPIQLFLFIIAVLIKGTKDRKAKGIIKSLFGMKFVKGIPDLREGQGVNIYLYKDKITLDDNQIIPLSRVKKALVFTEKELKLKDKSVIGRAALGGLLLGPLGAVVGGVSGVGDKRQEKTLIFFSIEYTDKNNDDGQLIFIAGDIAIGLNAFTNEINRMIGVVPTMITEAYEI